MNWTAVILLATAAAAGPLAAQTDAAADVRAAETAFAATLASRDLEAFAGWVSGRPCAQNFSRSPDITSTARSC